MQQDLFRTKACHNCGYCKRQSSDLYNGKPLTPDNEFDNLMICPYCNEPMVEEYKIADMFIDIFKNNIYEKYIKGNPEKEKLHKHMVEQQELLFQKQIDDMKRAYREHQPKCPTCGSAQVQQISSFERTTSVLTLGIFSKKINKSYKCRNCGYTW